MKNKARQQLRRQILAKRDALSPDERGRKSSMVADNLWQLEVFVQTVTLFIYINYRSEVETVPIIRQCLARGMHVTVPLTDCKSSGLTVYYLSDPDNDLKPGFCGIPEPIAGRLKAADPAVIETIILPGSVFDERGGRLGYGGGYYDRFVTYKAPHALRIGIAFEQQVVTEVPMLPHDKRCHVLVTEKRIIRIS